MVLNGIMIANISFWLFNTLSYKKKIEQIQIREGEKSDIKNALQMLKIK